MFFNSFIAMKCVLFLLLLFFLTVSSAVLRGSIIFNGVCRWIFRGKGTKQKTFRHVDVVSLSRVVVR